MTVASRVLCAGIGLLAMSGAVSAAEQTDLPSGTFASSEEGCKQLEMTPAAQLKDYDFEIFTSKGVVSADSRCDFLSVTARDDKSWIATAFCEQPSFSYPDMISVQKIDDQKLRVTKLTEIESDSGVATDLPPDETDNTSSSSNEIDTLEPGADQPAEAPSTDASGTTDIDPADQNIFYACPKAAR